MKKFKKGECAIYTLVYREVNFLPVWYKYYSQYFDDSDIYILNHIWDDGRDNEPDGTEGLNCNIEDVSHHSSMNPPFILGQYIKKHSELLKNYEYVISSDADEMLVPDPDKFDGLIDYIDSLKRNRVDIVRVYCYNVLHQRHIEPDIDWNEYILGDQRTIWMNIKTMNKILISSVLPGWATGRHFEMDNPHRHTDKNMILVHLKYADYKTLKASAHFHHSTGICQTPFNDLVGKDFDDYFDDHMGHVVMTGKDSQYYSHDTSVPKVQNIPERFFGII